MLTFNPLPGNYGSEVTEVIVDAPTGYTGLIAHGVYPAIVQTLASGSVEGQELPYLQAIDNGLGRVILDGSFPRYYNQRHIDDPTHDRNILFRNMLHYLSGKESGRMLVLGDATLTDHNGGYSVKSTGNNGFNLTLTAIAQWYGYELTIKDSLDFGEALDPQYQDLVGYDIIFLMSATALGARERVLTESAAQYIADLREAGVGILICTDHGDERGLYYKSANVLLGKIADAQFEGLYDLTPGTTVGYNRTLHGDSPIFKDLDDSVVIQADESISIVKQGPIPLPQTFPLTIALTDGINDIHITLVSPTGEITHYRSAYMVGEGSMFRLLDEQLNPIPNWRPTHLKTRRLYVEYTGTEYPTISGNIRVGNTLVAQFVDQVPGLLEANWLVTDYTLPSLGNLIQVPDTENPRISVDITEPVSYSMFWDFNRILYNEDHTKPSLARFLKHYNVEEFETDPPNGAKFFRNAQDLLISPPLEPSVSVAGYIQNLLVNNRVGGGADKIYPGPQELIGFYDQDLGPGTGKGFFGEVSTEDLIDGETLASLLGLSDGTAQNSTAPWLKFFIDDKIVYVAKQTYRHSISWTQIQAVDAVYGDRVITIAGYQYRIRLLKGLNPNTDVSFAIGFDTESSWNSEWNRLIYNICEQPDDPLYHKRSQIGENWANYTQDELNITDGNGYYSWCQETAPTDPSWRIARGSGVVSFLSVAGTSSANTNHGWRPVLELV